MDPLLTDEQLLLLGVASDALANVPETARDAARSSASAIAASYVAKRYRLPLVSWDDDIRQAAAWIAQRLLLGRRGFNPSAGNDQAIRQGFDDAIAWLEKVALGEVEPVNIVDSTPSVHEASPLLSSSPDDGPLWPVYGSRRGCR